DYVIATGETHSIREFLDVAFRYVGLNWEKHVAIDERYYRPAEVDMLIGDPSKAKRQLGWEPKIKFQDLVKLMVDADVKLLKDHLYNDPNIYNQRLFLHYAELDDPTTLRRVLMKALPDEIYHLAGQSHVGLSFEIPESTCEMTAMGTLRLLEMIRDLPKAARL